jgi:hypothetical protein
MFNFTANIFASFGALLGGLFGGHHDASSTQNMMQPMHRQEMASSTYGQGYASSTRGAMGRGMFNGVFGTVASVDGTELTVTGRNGTSTATTTFNVDASNAKIMKGSATSTASISDIAVGDHVSVQGTVSGTSVSATMIFDGKMGGLGMMGGRAGQGRMGSSTQPRGTQGAPGRDGGAPGQFGSQPMQPVQNQ